VIQERRWFLSFALVLVACGILMVHSASMTSRPTEFEQIYLSRHLVFLALGLCGATVASWISPVTWRKLAPWLWLATVLLLIAVLIPGIGTRVKGAQRWLRYGPASLQPSELAKITLPLAVCTLLYWSRSLRRTWVVGLILFPLPAVVLVPLVLLEPDLGTSLFLVLGVGVVLFLGGWPIRNFAVGAAGLVPAVVLVILQKPYMLQRISGFMTTWTNPSAAPYQVQQSLATLGAGGLWGVGLGKGWQKLSFLAEANTDFVFAVVGEELGLAGSLGVIGLWTGVFIAGYRLLCRLPRDSFEFVLGLTLLFQLVFQAALNIAVVTALVPPKGISHPLISYGGSNLVVSLISLGVILSLTRVPGSDTMSEAESSASLTP